MKKRNRTMLDMDINEQHVLLKLEEKFKENLTASITLEKEAYTKAEIDARAFAVLGQIIAEDNKLSACQKEIVPIFDEVFADVVLSLYFAGCGLERPAQSVLRRSFELGIAIIYLWDLPHDFYGWKKHDSDLNFNEMIEHLTKDSYRTYLASLNPSYIGDELFDEKDARKLYRNLSNTVHGKITTHTAYLPNRFSHNPSAWYNHIELVERIMIILMNLSSKRFFAYFPELKKRIPAFSVVEMKGV